MIDYGKKIKKDLLEQFKDQPKIEAFIETVAEQLQDVFLFYDQLLNERSVSSAVGKQLDGVGDIAALTRSEAAQIASVDTQVDVLDDETYRHYLIYKIMKNTCECTYPDIVKAFRMFWDKPLYYSEDPQQPATMIFDTGYLDGNIDTRPLFQTPLLKPAGVCIKIRAKTSTDISGGELFIASVLGSGYSETPIPEIK